LEFAGFMMDKPSSRVKLSQLSHNRHIPMLHEQGCGLCRCAKFGWNWKCSFQDMRISMLWEIGVKMPSHAILG